jgi:hypothetical protein
MSKLTPPTLQLSMWAASILYSFSFFVEKDVRFETAARGFHFLDNFNDAATRKASSRFIVPFLSVQIGAETAQPLGSPLCGLRRPSQKV